MNSNSLGHYLEYVFHSLKRMTSPRFAEMIEFIQHDCHLSREAIAIAFRHPLLSSNQVPIALWQLGLITLDDVSRIFDWMETQEDPNAIAA